MTTISTIEFLQAFYPEPVTPGNLVVWTCSRRSGKKRSYWLNTLDEAARQAHRLKRSRDVYFGVALQDPQAALAITRRRWPRVRMPSVRGSEESAVALPAIWADIDLAGPGHAQGALPPDRDAAFELLEAIPVPASIIVHTGGGFHVYWLLRELWLLENEAERQEAKHLLLKLQGALRAEAQRRGYNLDHTADLARVLRLPGTSNLKSQPGQPVRVVHFPLLTQPGAAAAGDYRYNPSDFDALPEPPAAPEPGARLLAGGSRHDDSPPARFRPIYKGCSWIRHAYENRRRLPEPEWYGTLGIVGRSATSGQDGRTLVHRFSQDHPGYNPAATDDKLEHALNSPGPHTCRQIAYNLGAHAAHCAKCPHFERIKSPIVLGRLGRPANDVAEGNETPRTANATAAGGGDGDDSTGHGSSGHGDDHRRPQILVDTREHRVNDEALAALAARESNLFERAGVLVHVVRQGPPPPANDEPGTEHHAANDEAGESPTFAPRPAGSAVVRPVHEARLRELLARACAFVTAKSVSRPSRAQVKQNGSRQEAQHREPARPKKVRLQPVHPPRWTVRALLARGSWPLLPTLEGLVECPVLRADGSVLQTPGYDPASGLVYAPSARFQPVPEAPTVGQVEEALIHLREVVADFPFQAEAHFAAWLSALLTPLARAAFEGPSPLNLIDANVRGSGKSLLADVCSTLLTGRSAARMSYSGDEDELRKAITGIALEATQLVLIDNICGAFGSPTLDRALTAETWRDRLLGSNDQVSIPLQVTWFATGNNVTLSGDTPRRCLHVRLESALERPEQRTDFRHPRLLVWLRRERPRLLPAALTLLRAYLAAGRPDQHLTGWGSYESWSDLVRSAVVWLGLPDPAETREELEAGSDSERTVVHDLIHGLNELLDDAGGSATTKEILEKLATTPLERYSLLRSAVAELFPRLKGDDLPRSTQFAGPLRANRGRIVRGACIDQLSKSYKGVRWTVRKLAQA